MCGTNWTRRGVALAPGGKGDLDHLGARNPVVVKRGGGYELWYQGKSASAPRCHVLRATSADGRAWKKEPGEVTLHPEDPLDGDEEMYVDSVLPLPDDCCQVFFAKENSSTRPVQDEGTVDMKRSCIYTEVVKP